jgi:ribosomal protein S27AE
MVVVVRMVQYNEVVVARQQVRERADSCMKCGGTFLTRSTRSDQLQIHCVRCDRTYAVAAYNARHSGKCGSSDEESDGRISIFVK